MLSQMIGPEGKRLVGGIGKNADIESELSGQSELGWGSVEELRGILEGGSAAKHKGSLCHGFGSSSSSKVPGKNDVWRKRSLKRGRAKPKAEGYTNFREIGVALCM